MMYKIYIFFFFIFLLIISRIIPHPPNFTPILATAIMSPVLLKHKGYAILLPIIAMFISDLIIGFHPYQLVIYTTLALISMFASTSISMNILKIFITVIYASILFFVITNFAVWFDMKPPKAETPQTKTIDRQAGLNRKAPRRKRR